MNIRPALSGYAFADTPLDRADKLRDDAEALLALWPQARILIVDDEGRAHADEAGQALAVTGAQLGGGPG
ncbi:MAG TPA: NADH pyrophosphatase, partial [Pseudoxanthomonas sp.]|nr:NADH pyrophosphatase [Pseudoxanthomonas sp.]